MLEAASSHIAPVQAQAFVELVFQESLCVCMPLPLPRARQHTLLTSLRASGVADGVPESELVIEVSLADSSRRALADQLIVTVRIRAPTEQATAAEAPEAVAERVRAIDVEALAEALGGVSASASTPRLEEVVLETEVECERGYWCSMGRSYACEAGFYQDETKEAIDLGACTICPSDATSKSSEGRHPSDAHKRVDPNHGSNEGHV